MCHLNNTEKSVKQERCQNRCPVGTKFNNPKWMNPILLEGYPKHCLIWKADCYFRPCGSICWFGISASSPTCSTASRGKLMQEPPNAAGTAAPRSRMNAWICHEYVMNLQKRKFRRWTFLDQTWPLRGAFFLFTSWVHWFLSPNFFLQLEPICPDNVFLIFRSSICIAPL